MVGGIIGGFLLKRRQSDTLKSVTLAVSEQGQNYTWLGCFRRKRAANSRQTKQVINFNYTAARRDQCVEITDSVNSKKKERKNLFDKQAGELCKHLPTSIIGKRRYLAEGFINMYTFSVF